MRVRVSPFAPSNLLKDLGFLLCKNICAGFAQSFILSLPRFLPVQRFYLHQSNEHKCVKIPPVNALLRDRASSFFEGNCCFNDFVWNIASPSAKLGVYGQELVRCQSISPRMGLNWALSPATPDPCSSFIGISLGSSSKERFLWPMACTRLV